MLKNAYTRTLYSKPQRQTGMNRTILLACLIKHEIIFKLQSDTTEKLSRKLIHRKHLINRETKIKNERTFNYTWMFY